MIEKLKDGRKEFKKSNVNIVLNVLCAKKKKIYPAYVSKHNLNCQKKLFFNDLKWGEKIQQQKN